MLHITLNNPNNPNEHVQFRSVEREQQSRDRLHQLVAAHYERVAVPTATGKGTEGGGEVDGEYVAATEKEEEVEEGKEEATVAEEIRALYAATHKPLYYALPLLMSRSFTNLSRQLELSCTRISQGMFFALILSCFYAPIEDDQNSVQNRIGCLYELNALQFIGMLNCIALFPTERNVFFREYVDGDYTALAFFLSFVLIAVPYLLVSALLIALLMTYAIGLQPDILATLEFAGVIFAFIFTGECVGLMFCAMFMHVGFAVNVMSVVLSLFGKCVYCIHACSEQRNTYITFFADFLFSPVFCLCNKFCCCSPTVDTAGIMAGYISIDMPQVLRDISQVAPSTWGSYVLSNIVFDGETFTCTSSEETADGTCVYDDGHDVLELYKMDGGGGRYGTVFHSWMLGLICTAYFLLAFAVLRWRAFKLSH